MLSSDKQDDAHKALTNSSNAIAELLPRAAEGDQSAQNKVFELLYDELKGVAVRTLSREGEAHSWQPTRLVNETYLKVCKQWPAKHERRVLLGCMAHVMREILIDAARTRKASKHGGKTKTVSATAIDCVERGTPETLLALDLALQKLDQYDRRLRDIVELKVFMGMLIADIAELLDLSEATIKSEWKVARAWLFKELNGEEGVQEPPSGVTRIDADDIDPNPGN